jgi:hypothetical protein
MRLANAGERTNGPPERMGRERGRLSRTGVAAPGTPGGQEIDGSCA